MNSWGGWPSAELSAQEPASRRREQVLVPLITAAIVLALGMLLVTLTCRLEPAASAIETSATATTEHATERW